MNILEAYRERIATLNYTPLTVDEAAQAHTSHAEAIASVRIEGIEMTSQDAAFFELLLEMRIPHAVAMPLVLQYGRDIITGAI